MSHLMGEEGLSASISFPSNSVSLNCPHNMLTSRAGGPRLEGDWQMHITPE